MVVFDNSVVINDQIRSQEKGVKYKNCWMSPRKASKRAIKITMPQDGLYRLNTTIIIIIIIILIIISIKQY